VPAPDPAYRVIQPAPVASVQQVSPVAVAAPPARAPVPSYVDVRPPSPSYADEPFDASMLPRGLNGGRRKRAIAIVALLFAVVVFGGLIALAIASQAVHGL
jgi:hypothetical protein